MAIDRETRPQKQQISDYSPGNFQLEWSDLIGGYQVNYIPLQNSVCQDFKKYLDRFSPSPKLLRSRIVPRTHAHTRAPARITGVMDVGMIHTNYHRHFRTNERTTIVLFLLCPFLAILSNLCPSLKRGCCLTGSNPHFPFLYMPDASVLRVGSVLTPALLFDSRQSNFAVHASSSSLL